MLRLFRVTLRFWALIDGEDKLIARACNVLAKSQESAIPKACSYLQMRRPERPHLIELESLVRLTADPRYLKRHRKAFAKRHKMRRAA
jgi:hypothetical protein